MNTKEDILKNDWNQAVVWHHLHTMEVNGAKVTIVLQNISLCVQQKKETHTGLQQLEGE